MLRLPLAFVAAALAAVPARAADLASLEQVTGWVRNYCQECHNADSPEAGLDLSGFAGAEDVAANAEN